MSIVTSCTRALLVHDFTCHFIPLIHAHVCVQVNYSGVVEWTSAAGVFTSFPECGQKTSDNISLTISPLTPSTEYVFQVVMVTPEGQGAEVRTVVTTEEEVGGKTGCTVNRHIQLQLSLLMFCSADKLAYFQIRILDISDCEEWHVSLG